MLKKICGILLVTLILFVAKACDSSDENLKIIVPNGAPSLAHAHLDFTQENDVYTVETVFGVDMLSAAFANASRDVIIAPVNMGARLVENTGAAYRLAGVLTWGNLHLVSQSPFTRVEDLSGSTIVLFGENSIPDATVRLLLDAWNLEVEPDIQYVEGVDLASARVQTDETAIVLLAEPALSVLDTKIDRLYTLDLQDEWFNAYEQNGYPQAGVFVRSDLDVARVKRYLEDLVESVHRLNTDTAAVADMAVSLGSVFAKPVIINATASSHIRFVGAVDARTDLEWYFDRLRTINPALVPASLPGDGFYFGE